MGSRISPERDRNRNFDREFDRSEAFFRESERLARTFDAGQIFKSEFSVVFALYRAELEGYTLTVSNIAEEVDVPHATVVRHLGRLDEKGWIMRSTHQSDRRICYVRLAAPLVRQLDTVFGREGRDGPVGRVPGATGGSEIRAPAGR